MRKTEAQVWLRAHGQAIIIIHVATFLWSRKRSLAVDEKQFWVRRTASKRQTKCWVCQYGRYFPVAKLSFTNQIEVYTLYDSVVCFDFFVAYDLCIVRIYSCAGWLISCMRENSLLLLEKALTIVSEPLVTECVLQRLILCCLWIPDFCCSYLNISFTYILRTFVRFLLLLECLQKGHRAVLK